MSNYEVGSIELGLQLNTKDYDRQIKGLHKIASKVAKTMAAAFTVKAAVNFGKQCLELGSDLQEVQNVVDTVFPNMESKVNKFAKNAATGFGLSETMAKRYTGTFGAMADAFGFAEKESYNMATALTGLAGDVASFYNITQDEAYTKLKSVFTGETESLKELGVVMTQNALDAYAMANGYGKVTSAMTEAEKVSLRFAFVQEQLSNASGDFAKTSGSWANQVRLLSLQFQSLQASIGQGLINVLTPVIQWLNALMSKLVSAANAFKKFTETLTGKKSQPITLKNTADGVDAVTTEADNASNSLGKTTKKIKALKRELAGFDQINKVSSPSSDSGSSSPSGPSGAASITGTPTTEPPGDVEKLTEKYKKLGKAVDKLKKSFKGFTDLMASAGKWTYNNVLVPLGNWTMNKLLPRIIELLASAFDVLVEALKALAPVFQTAWSIFFKPLAKFTGKVILAFLDAFTKLLNKLAVSINEHPKLFRGFTTALLGLVAVKKISSYFLNAASGIKMFRKGIISAGTLVSGLAPKLAPMVKAFGKGAALARTFGNTLKYTGSAGRAFSAVFPKLAKRAGVVSKALKFLIPKGPIMLGIMGVVTAGILLYKNWDKIKKGAAKLKKNVVKAFGSIVDSIKEVPAKIKQWFKGKIEGVEEWFGGIKDGFANMLEKLTDNIPDLSDIAVAISESIGEAKAVVTTWFADKKETLTEKWNTLTSGIKNKTAEMKASVKQKWSDIKDGWNNLTGNVKGKIAEMKAAVKQKWSDIKAGWNNLTSNVKAKTAEMKAKIASKWSDLKAKWTAVVNNIKDKTAAMKANIAAKKSSIQNAWKEVSGQWKDKVANFGLKFSAATSDLKKWVNTNVIDRVNDKFKKVPILKNHLIPHLAQGGYVKKNTPQLAMIGDNRHQGEVVSPEDKLLEMAKTAAAMVGGGTSPEVISLLREILAAIEALKLDVYLDGKLIKKRIVELINTNTAATGVCEIKL